MRRFALICLVGSVAGAFIAIASSVAAERPNVLFVIVDDLRRKTTLNPREKPGVPAQSEGAMTVSAFSL